VISNFIPLKWIHPTILDWTTNFCLIRKMNWKMFHGSKKPGDNICSILHNNRSIFSSKILKCSTFNVMEVNSIKKRLNSTTTFQIGFANESKTIGSKHCLKTWQSWLFIPCNFPLLRSTHLPKVEIYLYRRVSSLTHSQIDTLWDLVNPYAAFSLISLLRPMSFNFRSF